MLERTPTLYELVATTLLRCAPVASTERLSIVTAELGDDAGPVGAAALAALADADCARPIESAMIEQVTHAKVTDRDVVELRFSLPADKLAELSNGRPASCTAEETSVRRRGWRGSAHPSRRRRSETPQRRNGG